MGVEAGRLVGRVVVVRDGAAVELLIAARLLKPAHTAMDPTP